MDKSASGGEADRRNALALFRVLRVLFRPTVLAKMEIISDSNVAT
jgi:hypothetical protein